MGIVDRARFALARLLYKAGGLAIVPRWVDTTVLEPSWRALSRDGYQRNASVFACVSVLSFDMAEPPLCLYTPQGEMIDQGQLARLLRRPNAMMSQRELMQIATVYAAVGGNAYLHVVRDRRGQPVELWPYHAGQMIPIPNTDPNAAMWIERYDYDDGTSRLYPVPVQDVIHLRWPSVDLLQPWQALPPLAAVAADVDAGNEAIRYIRALLKNDATPRVVLTTPTGAFLSDETVSRMKEQWSERYGGDQRGSVAVLEEGVTLQRLSLDMSEMAFEALMRVPETHIAAAFRIPPIIAGIGAGLDASTYSNYAEARQAYTQQTLTPLWAAWAEEIDAVLAQPAGLKIAYDLSKIAALRENQNAVSDRTISQWTSGLITRNEARKALGLPEDEYGNVYAMPTNLMLVPVELEIELEVEAPDEPDMPDDEPEEPDDSPDDDEPQEPEQRAAPVSSITPAREYVPPQIDDVAMSMSRRLRRYLSEQYRRAADALRALEPEMATRALEDQLPLDFGENIAEIMRQFYPLLLERSWDNAVTQIGVDLAFDLENPKVQETLHLLALQVRGISDTTREEIRGIVGRMASEGISYDAAAREIVQLAGIHSAARARTIAVTESARAWTQGSILAWQETGEVDRMEWSAEPDCCPICRSVNGTVVPLGTSFQGLMPPAHPNCRCALLPVLIEEVVGPQPATFNIKDDGTLDYKPSTKAEQIYALLSDPNSVHDLRLKTYVNRIELSEEYIQEQKELLDKTRRRIKRLKKDSPERLLEEQKMRTIERAIISVSEELKEATNTLTEEIKKVNPFASPNDAKPSKEDFRFDGDVSVADRTRVTARVRGVQQILQNFIPTVDANGNAINLGFRSSQVFTVRVSNNQPREEASFFPGSTQYATDINIGVNTPTKVVLHEMLHNIHDLSPRMAARINAWYRTRTAPGKPGSELQTLIEATGIQTYKPDEMTRIDKFATPYIGKEYKSDNQGLEVLSMFADYLMSSSIERSDWRWRDDPEWIKLCIDLLMDPESYS